MAQLSFENIYFYVIITLIMYSGKMIKFDKKEVILRFSYKRLTLLLLIFCLIGGITVFYKSNTARSANYGWVQTAWSGGASTTATGKHSTDQTGWTKYQSLNNFVSTSTEGQISLKATTTFWTDTTTNNFASGTASNVYVSNGTVYLKKPFGVSCSSDSECTTGKCASTCRYPQVGDTLGGGIVFYTYNGGINGWISQTSDISISTFWGCNGTNISGAESLTDGKQNTADIDAGCTTAGIAADLCKNAATNGYNDWYLPAKDQLTTLYGQRGTVGGFSTGGYCSSTEYSGMQTTVIWALPFSSGSWSGYGKDMGNYYVRCIRNF